MSRMRLMKGGGDGAGALVCLHCGAEAALRPPYAVVYCDCRSHERGDGSTGAEAPVAERAA